MISPRPTIDLFESESLNLIVAWPSGVVYTNQTSGLACEHPEVEGVLVPLFDGIGHPAMHSLRQHFRGDWHQLAEDDMDIVDGILRRNYLGFIKCDRKRSADSKEAWVHVLIEEDTAPRIAQRILGFGPKSGVLTWPNSD